VTGIRNPISETSAVLGCAGLHPMKPVRLTICTMMDSSPSLYSLSFFILSE
jgi:hypothetical protein